MIEIKNDDKTELLNGKVLVDFYANWCGPCKMFAPVFEKFSNDHKEITCIKVNIDENPNLTNLFAIMSVPTIILLENGQEIKKEYGYLSYDKLEELIK